MANEERFKFTVLWKDPISGLETTYRLTIFPTNSSVEIYDTKRRAGMHNRF